LKKSLACGAEPIERLSLPHFVQKSSSNLSIESDLGLDLATGPLFSKRRPKPGTTSPVFPLGSV
jgi:hypothetical protein